MQTILQIATAVYLPIIAAALVGVLLSLGLTRSGRMVGDQPVQEYLPNVLARFLYLVGIPIGVANFIRKAEFNPSVWISPVIAWSAVLLAIFLSWHFLKGSAKPRSKSTKASFTLLSYLGNTSYLGFPVILLLPQLGPQYFSSAVLYDILGTLVAGYGLGVFFAGQASRNTAEGNTASISRSSASEGGSAMSSTKRGGAGALLDALTEVAKNPTFYAFFVGLYLKTLTIPEWIVSGLGTIAWSSIMVALIVMGMRIQQLSSNLNLKLAIQPVLIKTILVPLVLAAALTGLGLEGPQRLVLILQSAMPCGFISLVLAENYGLDVELTVASILLSCIVFAFMLPVWVTLFTTW
ncbi:AEC family transporter [Synechococcus sp. UW140]|uniref:AEC family transporter n=1 Tax=Synechococcus sp. UW140 TaxID=368503 RepID=UPI0025D0C020|nr:AEC family transporter [Synechococcus sp. UW140]